ncbi:MAG: NAD(P)H-hydrate dehydratase [Clostridium sp.]|nr:NAD(P)H-hydrate dehydratase [Clostridium sp.]
MRRNDSAGSAGERVLYREYLLSPAGMKEADQNTIDKAGISSAVLMERAALSVADAVSGALEGRRNPAPETVYVFAGRGNNGADGIAAARILAERGIRATVWLTDVPSPESEGAVQQKAAEYYGVPCRKTDEYSIPEGRVPFAVIDALFGTGFHGKPEGRALEAIREINRLRREGALVVSVDIPSGVSGADGSIPGECVRADITVTFSYYKAGHFLYPGRAACGELIRSQIGITDRSLGQKPGIFTYLASSGVPGRVRTDLQLPERNPAGHKGSFGKVLLAAGDFGMCGAAVLSARACCRAGAGMVRVFTPESNRIIIQQSVPEALISTFPDEEAWEDGIPPLCAGSLESALSWCDTIAVGPGLGRGKRAVYTVRHLLEYAAACGDRLKGMVIDADALRIISADEDLYRLLKMAGAKLSVILTPHLAECAALLHVNTDELAEDKMKRLRLIRDFCSEYHVTLAAKDAATMVASCESDEVYLNTTGNDGLAGAGSGDVLTGIISGLTAQGMEGSAAAAAGVFLHGLSADIAVLTTGRRSLTASDVIDHLQDAFFEVSSGKM